VIARYVQLQKQKTRKTIMRLLILAAAATLAFAGTAMAQESVPTGVKGAKHHHYREANASVAEDTAPADTLNAHDAHLRNLRDSGYNPSGDRDGAGNIRQY
jgi:hypothetical protein